MKYRLKLWQLILLAMVMTFVSCHTISSDKVIPLNNNWQIARKTYSANSSPPVEGWTPVNSILQAGVSEDRTEEIWFRNRLPVKEQPEANYLLVGLTNPCEIYCSNQKVLTFGAMQSPPSWPGIGYFLEALPPGCETLEIRCLPATPQLRLLEPMVGTYRAIIAERIPDVIVRVSLSLLYLGLGLAILALYLSFKKPLRDTFYLNIGLFFLLAGAFNLSSGNALLGTVLQAPLFTAITAHLTAFLLPVPLLLMVRQLIRASRSRWLNLLAGLHLGLLLISLVLPLFSRLSLESFSQPFRVLFMVTLLSIPIAILRNLNRQNPDLLIFFIGALVTIVSAIFDLVQTFLYRQALPTAHLYGLFFFVTALLIIVVRRFLAVVEFQEQYSRNLEDSVRERTQKLNSALKEIQSDLNTARKFQQKMLPDLYELQRLPLKTAARFIPMNAVGGDIYFVTPLSNGKIRYFIADAAGHGIEAAIVTIAIKGEFEANSPQSQNPNQLLELLNIKFVAKYRSLNTFFSAAVCDIDPQSRKLSFASAGHPPQFLNHGGKIVTLSHTGPLLGIMEKVSFGNHEYPFEPGDSLLLFTDGILEQTKVENGQRHEFGEHRLAEILLALTGCDAVDIADIVETELIRYSEESPQDDDITLICVSY